MSYYLLISKSAGVCVEDGQFFVADTSGLQQPFSDAFVTFHITKDGFGGSNVVPYLPREFFDAYEMDQECPKAKQKQNYDIDPWGRFGKIWFKNKDIENYLQIMGVGNTKQLDNCTVCGGTWPAPQIFGQSLFYGSEEISNRQILVFRGAMEWPCATADQIDNATRQTVNHEVGHQFYVNPTASNRHDCRCSWPYAGQPPVCPVNDAGGCDVENCSTCCVMCEKRDKWNYSFKFDGDDLICGDAGCPNGYAGCCANCSMAGNGSIRQLYDPLKGQQP